MKALAAVVFALALCTSLQAQTAKVIILAPEDSAQAKAAWDRLQQAQKDWKALKEKIGDKYTTMHSPVSKNPTRIFSCDGNYTMDDVRVIDGEKSWVCVPLAWQGWEFSEDFKAITPTMLWTRP